MKNQIVIARYNEDITYLSEYYKIVLVYNKGDSDTIPINFEYINLPNIGRESHTYLYHIIQNYDNLADKTLFIQGNTKDHNIYSINDYFNNSHFYGKKSTHEINFLKTFINHSGKYLKELLNKNLKKSIYTPYQWINLLGIDITKLNKFEMVWGANFSISKELIHKKPIEFYKDIIKYVEYDINPEEGHYFERSWYIIFMGNFIKIKIILYHNVKLFNYDITKYNDILNNNIKEIHLFVDNTKFNIFNYKYINNENLIYFYPIIENDIFYLKIKNNYTDNYIIKIGLNNTTYIIKLDINSIKLYEKNKENKNNIEYKNSNIQYIIIKKNNNNIFLLNNYNKILLRTYSNDISKFNSIEINNNIFYNINYNKSIFLFNNIDNKTYIDTFNYCYTIDFNKF